MKKKLLLLLSALTVVGIIFFGFTSRTLAVDVELPPNEFINGVGSSNPPGEVCPVVCTNENLIWNGNWTNSPPSGGRTVCGCRFPTRSELFESGQC